MTINFFIRKRDFSLYAPPFSTIHIRLRDGRAVDQTVRTPYFVDCRQWGTRSGKVIPAAGRNAADWQTVNACLDVMRQRIAYRYLNDSVAGKVGPDWLRNAVSTETGRGSGKMFSKIFDEFVHARRVSDARREQYYSVKRLIIRFLYCDNADHRMDADIASFDSASLIRIYEFAKNEDTLYAQDPQFRELFPRRTLLRKRCDNTINEMFRKLRAFFHWCKATGLTENDPFDNFKIHADAYGTPVYLTKEELHRLQEADLSRYPRLQRQRDVFVFQCNVGCRVGDLRRLRKSNVVDGVLEYIPAKTAGKRPVTVSIPLNRTASEIISRYKDCPDDSLLPCISLQKYNESIKEIFHKMKLDRNVIVLDSGTRREKLVPLYEIASSHMARRTFVGILYKEIRDPEIISSLTGHCEGSKAFTRYRAIGNDIKRELVEKLD